MNYLLDTNIISETTKVKPDANLVSWLAQYDNQALYLSVISIGEIRKGIEALPDSSKKNKLITWLETDLRAWFQDRILNIDQEVAEKWGYISAKDKSLCPVDAFLAAICLVRGLKLVTRNTKDFSSISGLELINPFLS